MIERVSVAELRDYTDTAIDGMSDHDRDEMAIPSYLHGNPLIRWLMWRRYETIASLMRATQPNAALEFGCGTGLFLPTLCRRYACVAAIDLFPEFAMRLAQARELNVHFIDELSDLEPGSIDTIVAADVLEHLDDVAGYLTLFRRALRAGGELLVSGPTESRWYQFGRVIAGFGDKGDYHHTNIDDLITKISASDFTITKSVPLPFACAPPLFKIVRFEAL